MFFVEPAPEKKREEADYNPGTANVILLRVRRWLAGRFSAQLLAHHRWGRVVLHFCCLCRGGQSRWHWAGVKRELRSRRS